MMYIDINHICHISFDCMFNILVRQNGVMCYQEECLYYIGLGILVVWVIFSIGQEKNRLLNEFKIWP